MLSLIAVCLTFGLTATAQPSGKGPEGRDRGQHSPMSIEQQAQMRVDAMSAELPLTDKQVKKLIKFYKKDISYRQENFGSGRGRRPEGREGFGGPQGGRHPGGGPGMGGPEMGPGGRHPEGGPGMRPDGQGGRPPMIGEEMDFEKLEKYNLKQEKKLRKILGDNLYSQWRTSHPQEAPKLPEVEFK